MNLSSPAAVHEPFSAIWHDTRDADDHASCLQRWNQRYDQLTAGVFSGTFEEFWFGNVQIFRERTNQSVHEAGQAWAGSRTFGVPIEVDGPGWYCGETLDFNSVITLRGGDELDFRTPRLHDVLAVTTSAQALNDYALQVEHRDIEAELGDRRTVPGTAAQADALRAFLRTVMASLRATPDMLRHAPMRKGLEQAVYGALLAAIGGEPEHRSPSGNARQLVVERARDYMRHHIDEPITVADLCAELRVSRRTLQYSFQDVLNLNPVSFLRALRLNGVRRALKRAEPGGETVADIAARWGFWHLSHFASDYKAMFGELPSETLRHVDSARR
ncbi:helix-turn-helix domain-containing protein [Azoarcus olearius]|uniref:Ethanolamine operon transcriptional regulator n=1 Tax=Azoarcus sp. (strain BH72) TaxID=418699 RepID=A1K7S3_AZOSB|nr:helix-turn-helix domain-containing protein [Azoarcus olearius]ANQ85423.1 putative ethanolamine operon transcriptional regulator [Azoarcus olearius]CAL94878.1 putative ethanolamine operon transcriptional regulator [Azoarcus olearius]